MPETPADLLTEARKTVPEISSEEAKAKLDPREVDLIVDVRERDGREAGHTPGPPHPPPALTAGYAEPHTPTPTHHPP